MKLTECNVQDALAREMISRQHCLVCPNTHLYWWGSDLITVTGAGFVNEFEIKVARSDYKKELDAASSSPGRRKSPVKWTRHRVLSGNMGVDRGPNYFWFVMPQQFMDEFGIPDYAGLIVPEVVAPPTRDPFVCINVVQRPPRLHTAKIQDRHRAALARGVMLRYWNLRDTKNRECHAKGLE